MSGLLGGDVLITVEVLNTKLTKLATSRHVLRFSWDVNVTVVVLDSQFAEIALRGFLVGRSGWDQFITVVMLNAKLTHRALLTVRHIHHAVVVGMVVGMVVGAGWNKGVTVVVLDTESAEPALLTMAHVHHTVVVGVVMPCWNKSVTVVVLDSKRAKLALLTMAHIHHAVVVGVVVSNWSNVVVSEVVGDGETLVFVATHHAFAHEVGNVLRNGLRNDLVLGHIQVGLDRVDLEGADGVFRAAILGASLSEHETVGVHGHVDWRGLESCREGTEERTCEASFKEHF